MTSKKKAECMPATGQERLPQSQRQPAVDPGSCLSSFLPMQESAAHGRVEWCQWRYAKAVEKMYICHKKRGKP